MSRDIPFFEMFTELQLSGELRLALAGAVINNACIDQAAMALVLHLTTQIELGEAEAAELRRLLSGVLRLSVRGAGGGLQAGGAPVGTFGSGGCGTCRFRRRKERGFQAW